MFIFQKKNSSIESFFISSFADISQSFLNLSCLVEHLKQITFLFLIVIFVISFYFIVYS